MLPFDYNAVLQKNVYFTILLNIKRISVIIFFENNEIMKVMQDFFVLVYKCSHNLKC